MADLSTLASGFGVESEATEIVDHLMVVNAGQPGRHCAGGRQGVQAQAGAVDLGVLGAVLGLRLGGGLVHRWRGIVAIDGVNVRDEDVQVGCGEGRHRRE